MPKLLVEGEITGGESGGKSIILTVKDSEEKFWQGTEKVIFTSPNLIAHLVKAMGYRDYLELTIPDHNVKVTLIFES